MAESAVDEENPPRIVQERDRHIGDSLGEVLRHKSRFNEPHHMSVALSKNEARQSAQLVQYFQKVNGLRRNGAQGLRTEFPFDLLTYVNGVVSRND